MTLLIELLNQRSHVTRPCFEYKYGVSKDSNTPIFTMRPLIPSSQDHIIHLLNSGMSGQKIQAQTGISAGTISFIRTKHCPNLPIHSGGCPKKLTSANISHAK